MLLLKKFWFLELMNSDTEFFRMCSFSYSLPRKNSSKSLKNKNQLAKDLVNELGVVMHILIRLTLFCTTCTVRRCRGEAMPISKWRVWAHNFQFFINVLVRLFGCNCVPSTKEWVMNYSSYIPTNCWFCCMTISMQYMTNNLIEKRLSIKLC